MEENYVSVNTNTFMSAEINEISEALSEFQGIIEQPKLEKEVKVTMKSGGTYKFKYADLSACVKAAAPALKASGLSVTQIITEGKLITLLAHKSGQWFKSELFLPQQTSDYQGYGSAITYLKRYSYCAILGIAADTDDDANVACGNGVEMRDRKSGEKQVNTVAFTGEQLQQALADLAGCATKDQFDNVWVKWANSVPALCNNETEFYKAAYKKVQSLQNSVA